MMNYGNWSGMMGGGWGSFMYISMIVWTIVGILAAIWLWKQITK